MKPVKPFRSYRMVPARYTEKPSKLKTGCFVVMIILLLLPATRTDTDFGGLGRRGPTQLRR